MTAAVFLDKDGTVVDDVPYNVEPAVMRLARGAAAGLHALSAHGYPLFIVSNQPGVALGLHRERDLQPVWDWLVSTLAPHGVAFAGIYWCPHHPHGIVAEYARACDCRKPKPGLLQRAAREHNLSLADSWFVGDILDDIEAGRRAGCRTVLVDNGNETEWVGGPLRSPHHTVADLREAAQRILADAAAAPARAAAR